MCVHFRSVPVQVYQQDCLEVYQDVSTPSCSVHFKGTFTPGVFYDQ